MRTIDGATAAILADDSLRIAHLLTFEFSSTLTFTDYAHDITHNAVTYLAANGFVGLSDPSESQELRINSLNVEMSGVDQSFISIFLSSNWVNRRTLLQTAFIDATGQVVGEPISIFDGLISDFDITESQNKSTVNITVSSHWADFERKAGRFTNSNSQQFFFAGDLGMDFSASIVTDLKWGKL